MSRRGTSSSAAAAAIILPPALSRLTAHLGYTAFIELLRSGTLSPGDARHLAPTPLPLIRMGAGLGVDGVVCRSLLKVLCCNGAMRPEEVLHVLRHGMPDLGCAPCVVSYTVVLKSFCGEGKSQQAHHLLRSMAAQGGACSPNLVSYSTVIHGLLTEGQHGKAFALLDEMRRQGIIPNVVTYNSIINFWCKAKSIEKAEAILQQMRILGCPLQARKKKRSSRFFSFHDFKWPGT
nr:unnamed protein product [Digitaria exilis]